MYTDCKYHRVKKCNIGDVGYCAIGKMMLGIKCNKEECKYFDSKEDVKIKGEINELHKKYSEMYFKEYNPNYEELLKVAMEIIDKQQELINLGE